MNEIREDPTDYELLKRYGRTEVDGVKRLLAFIGDKPYLARGVLPNGWLVFEFGFPKWEGATGLWFLRQIVKMAWGTFRGQWTRRFVWKDKPASSSGA